jgi:hypothetical protein
MSMFNDGSLFDVFRQPQKKRLTSRERFERKVLLRLQKLLGIRDILTRLSDAERRIGERDSRSCKDLRNELKDVRVDARALNNLLTQFNARSNERHRLLEQRMDRVESEK